MYFIRNKKYVNMKMKIVCAVCELQSDTDSPVGLLYILKFITQCNIKVSHFRSFKFRKDRYLSAIVRC